MITITYINNWDQLHCTTDTETLVNFLYNNLDRFRDSRDAIRKAVSYALSEESGKGGFIALAKEGDEIVGSLVMNDTGMSEYIPEYILVYVAVRADQRGKGIGAQIIRAVVNRVNKPIALHVEYDNPAKRLYERLGFTTKYAEMRFNPEAK